MDKSRTLDTVEAKFATAVPAIEEYIRIPNQSPHFDKDVLTNGTVISLVCTCLSDSRLLV